MEPHLVEKMRYVTSHAHRFEFFHCGHLAVKPLDVGPGEVAENHYIYTSSTPSACGTEACANTDPKRFLEWAAAEQYGKADTDKWIQLHDKCIDLQDKALSTLLTHNELQSFWTPDQVQKLMPGYYAAEIAALMMVVPEEQENAIEKFLPQLFEVVRLLGAMRQWIQENDSRNSRTFYNLSAGLASDFLWTAEERLRALTNTIKTLAAIEHGQVWPSQIDVGVFIPRQAEFPYCPWVEGSWDFSPELGKDLGLLHNAGGEEAKKLLEMPLAPEAFAQTEGLIEYLRSEVDQHRKPVHKTVLANPLVALPGQLWSSKDFEATPDEKRARWKRVCRLNRASKHHSKVLSHKRPKFLKMPRFDIATKSPISKKLKQTPVQRGILGSKKVKSRSVSSDGSSNGRPSWKDNCEFSRDGKWFNTSVKR